MNDSPYSRIVGDFRAAKSRIEIDAAANKHREEILKLHERGDAAVYNSIREAYKYYRRQIINAKLANGRR